LITPLAKVLVEVGVVAGYCALMRAPRKNAGSRVVRKMLPFAAQAERLCLRALLTGNFRQNQLDSIWADRRLSGL
jgi:hypothetical protein